MATQILVWKDCVRNLNISRGLARREESQKELQNFEKVTKALSQVRLVDWKMFDLFQNAQFWLDRHYICLEGNF